MISSEIKNRLHEENLMRLYFLAVGLTLGLKCWTNAGTPPLIKEFKPVKVREALDTRDRFTGKKRSVQYAQFSELAGHPTIKSALMMRPQKDGNAVIGPFMEATTLEAVLSEAGRLAVQVGELLNRFFPADWQPGMSSRLAFAQRKKAWIDNFYPGTQRGASGDTQQTSPIA